MSAATRAVAGRLSLLDALEVAAGAASTGDAVPITKHVLLDVGADGSVTFTGTDQEQRAWATAAARCTGDALVCVAPEPLLALLRRADADEVALEIGVTRVTATAGTSSVRLGVVDAEGYPPAPDFAAPLFEATVDAGPLADALRVTAAMTEEKDSDIWKTGVRLWTDGESLHAWAATFARVATRAVPCVAAASEGVIVAGKALRKVAPRLRAAATARIAATDAWALFDTEAGCWAVRTLAAAFPPLGAILGGEAAYEAFLGRAPTISALRTVVPVAAGDGDFARFVPTEGGMVVRAETSVEAAEALVPTDGPLSGEPFSLNARMLLAAAESFDQEVLRLRWAPVRPVLIDAGSPDEAAAAIMVRAVAR